MTPNEHALLGFIRLYKDKHGYAPSFSEMATASQLKSKTGIYRRLQSLEEQGFIRRMRYKTRAIEIVENPTLPINIESYTQRGLALEANRRGLVLGRIVTWESGSRTFVEIKS